MKTKKLTFTLLFLSLSLTTYAQNYSQKSNLKVLSVKSETLITFDITQNETGLLLTVHPFSYKDKKNGEFSLQLKQDNNNPEKYSIQNITVQSKNPEAEISVLSCKLDMKQENPELYIKYKPGKMPFPITLSKSDAR